MHFNPVRRAVVDSFCGWVSMSSKSMRLQPFSLDRNGRVRRLRIVSRQAISSTLLSTCRRARAIAIAPRRTTTTNPRSSEAKRERSERVDDEPPRREQRSEARAERARASNPRGANHLPQAPSPLQRARPGEVRKEGRGDRLKSNSEPSDTAIPVQ